MWWPMNLLTILGLKKENWVSKEIVLGPSIKTYTVLCGHLIIRKGCSLVTISVCGAFKWTYTSSTKSKLDSWRFNCTTLVANTVTTLSLVVKRDSIVVGGSRLCVVRHVEDGNVQTRRGWDNRWSFIEGYYIEWRVMPRECIRFEKWIRSRWMEQKKWLLFFVRDCREMT